MENPLSEPSPEVLERPANGALSASAAPTAPTEGADPDPDQYLWGV